MNMEETTNYTAGPNIYCEHCGGLIEGVYTGEILVCRCAMKQNIETAIRQTLVVGNKKSIPLAVDKIMEIVGYTLPKFNIKDI